MNSQYLGYSDIPPFSLSIPTILILGLDELTLAQHEPGKEAHKSL